MESYNWQYTVDRALIEGFARIIHPAAIPSLTKPLNPTPSKATVNIGKFHGKGDLKRSSHRIKSNIISISVSVDEDTWLVAITVPPNHTIHRPATLLMWCFDNQTAATVR